MSNRRRILRVKNKFQDQMIVEIILTTFIFINMLVIVSFFAIESVRDIFRLKFTLAMALAAGEFGGLLIVYFYTLKASHKIAGPVYMIERRLKEIGTGNLTVSLRLRKSDHFHDTCDVLNHTVEQLRSRVQAIRKEAIALRDKSDAGTNTEQWNTLMQTIDAFKVDMPSITHPAAEHDAVDAEAGATATPR